MLEEWVPITDYEGLYDISSWSRVYSFISNKTLKPTPNADGYLGVTLYKDKKRKQRYVHDMVLEGFIGSRPPGMQACHGDDNPANNASDNLRWDTWSENQLDAVRRGRNQKTLRTHCPSGHEYSEENTRRNRRGHRQCRTCYP